MGNEWKNSLFSCFGNLSLCLITYFVPCVPFGQATEEAGTCGCMGGALSLFVPILDIWMMYKTYKTVREKNNIDGGLGSDCFAVLCCPFCAIVQMRREQTGEMGQSIDRV